MEAPHADPAETEEAPADDQELGDAELNEALLLEASVFDAIDSRYLNALAGYMFELHELREAGGQPSERPAHPAGEFFPIFNTLSDQGNGPATYWLVQNAEVLIPDEQERVTFYKDNLTRLANRNATGKYIKLVLDDLLTLRSLLGEEFTLGVLRTIEQRSRRRTSAAKAFYCEARVLVAGEHGQDPERRRQADELYRILVDGYPGTESAKLAGTPLLKALLESMRDSQGRWLEAARVKLAAGEDPSSWGPLPYADVRPLIATIAGAEHPTAMAWAHRIFPALDQAARESVGAAIAAQAEWLSARFGNNNQRWMAHKFDLLDLLFRAFPDEQYTFTAVEELAKHIQSGDATLTVAALDTLLEHTSEERVRGEAQLVLARALARSRSFRDLQRASEMFEAAASTAPIERQRKEAEELGVPFKWSMPGVVHPTLNLIDTDNSLVSTVAYRGKILVLYFWTLTVSGGAEDLRFVNELQARYADQPFRILGLNCQTMDLRGFARVAAKYKITWRNTLLQLRANIATNALWVSTFPHHFVIDAEGVIRGRGLTHAETYALVDELLAEMRLKQSPAGQAVTGRGTLHGRVEFAGELPPLEPLVLSDEQREACAARGGSMDLANRTRLVSSAGGLANVVVTIHVPGAIASGLGERREVEQLNCRYQPHVLLLNQGARLEINNKDTVLHGASARSLHNASFNVVLPPGLNYSTELKALDHLELTSATHPWMSSWVVVTDTPHHALTDSKGEFEIPNLPPGKYKAEWWHESLGEGRTLEFEIKAEETTRIEWALGAE